jgi:hypothetical protein
VIAYNLGQFASRRPSLAGRDYFTAGEGIDQTQFEEAFFRVSDLYSDRAFIAGWSANAGNP